MAAPAPKATRQAFGEALAALGETCPEIVVLDADLAKSTKSEIFAKKFPDRFLEMGIAEANMIGTAAGLSFTGKLPFLCSFGCFVTGRFDTIRVSVGYSRANVRIVGTHAGVSIGEDGHSQMGLEDVALMRTIPGMGVFQPMDARETELVMEYLVREWKGPAYLRLTRQNLPALYPADAPFLPTKLLRLASGPGKGKVALIGSGSGTAEAVAAGRLLLEAGIGCEVWNALCLKPFDENGARSIAAQCDLIATIEDHYVIGGLGSAVCESLSALGNHAPVERFGVQDAFGQSGLPEELPDVYGFGGRRVFERIRARLAESPRR